MNIDAVSGIKTAQKMAGGLRLAPSIGNKLIGDASAVQLAGIVRLTARNMNAPELNRATCFRSGADFVKWFNEKFLNPNLFKEGFTADGRFTEGLKEALNKTGCTVNDFAKWVKDMISVGQFFDNPNRKASMIKSRFEKIIKEQKIEIKSIEDAKNFLETSKQQGGIIKKIFNILAENTGLTIEKGIDYCDKANKIKDALEGALKRQ